METIQIAVYITHKCKLVSSHRTSDGWVYGGYTYHYPSIRSSLPFFLSDEKKKYILQNLSSLFQEDEYDDDLYPEYGCTYSLIEESKGIVNYLNETNTDKEISFSYFDLENDYSLLNIPNVKNETDINNSILEECYFTLNYKKDYERFLSIASLEYCITFLKYGVPPVCSLEKLKGIVNHVIRNSNKDISEYIDSIYMKYNSEKLLEILAGISFCNTMGELYPSISNSTLPIIKKIKEYILKGYTYQNLVTGNHSMQLEESENICKLFEKIGASNSDVKTLLKHNSVGRKGFTRYDECEVKGYENIDPEWYWNID